MGSLAPRKKYHQCHANVTLRTWLKRNNKGDKFLNFMTLGVYKRYCYTGIPRIA